MHISLIQLSARLAGHIDASAEQIRSGIIRSEHDWSTWLALCVENDDILRSAGLRPIVEYRINYHTEFSPKNNPRIDLAII
jgi:hypothetical protein